MKNYIPEIAKILGVKVGEKFRLYRPSEKDYRQGIYYFNEEDLRHVFHGNDYGAYGNELMDIIQGFLVIRKDEK